MDLCTNFTEERSIAREKRTPRKQQAQRANLEIMQTQPKGDKTFKGDTSKREQAKKPTQASKHTNLQSNILEVNLTFL